MNTNIGSPIQYELSSDTDSILMNKFIGHKMTLTYHQEINCIECGRKTKKSFFQGFCYPCFINSPQTSECILHPERCRAHEGVGRDIEWEKKYWAANAMNIFCKNLLPSLFQRSIKASILGEITHSQFLSMIAKSGIFFFISKTA
mgnify:CR=1 FL=1